MPDGRDWRRNTRTWWLLRNRRSGSVTGSVDREMMGYGSIVSTGDPRPGVPAAAGHGRLAAGGSSGVVRARCGRPARHDRVPRPATAGGVRAVRGMTRTCCLGVGVRLRGRGEVLASDRTTVCVTMSRSGCCAARTFPTTPRSRGSAPSITRGSRSCLRRCCWCARRRGWSGRGGLDRWHQDRRERLGGGREPVAGLGPRPRPAGSPRTSWPTPDRVDAAEDAAGPRGGGSD